MSEKKTIHIIMSGSGWHEDFYAFDHKILPYPAGTYHQFTLTDGRIVYYNDFGMRALFLG